MQPKMRATYREAWEAALHLQLGVGFDSSSRREIPLEAGVLNSEEELYMIYMHLISQGSALSLSTAIGKGQGERHCVLSRNMGASPPKHLA